MTPRDHIATTQIQAYVGAESVWRGAKLQFFVSVQVDGAPYYVEIFRLGWYGGLGARLVHVAREMGRAQGYYDEETRGLVSCPTCRVDSKTGLIEANWRDSFDLTIPTTWLSGVYLARFVLADGVATQAQFIVRDNRLSPYLAVIPSTTFAAYNPWGGYSLYEGPDHRVESRAVKVSFDRPMTSVSFMQSMTYEVDAVRWIERKGYDVTYVSDIDLHAQPAMLLDHTAYLSLGHDEYWTKEMRDGVELARDAGINLAFFGANASYWQMRFEPSSAGVANRVVVCYKMYDQVGPRTDPLSETDPSRVTTQWRDPHIGRPENALIGVMYSNFNSQPSGFPWRASATPGLRLLAGTGLVAQQEYGCQIVGTEWDKAFNNGAGPKNLHVLSDSPTMVVSSHATTADTSNSAYYVAPSGALVFASGSLKWAYALDMLRLVPDDACQGKTNSIPEIERLMTNVMDALGHRAPQV
jgi:hypothetical protein